MRKFALFSSLGFSIVESLVGVTLLFGLGFGVMKISQTQTGSTVKQKTTDELSRDMVTIRQLISDPGSCNHNFKDRMINTDIPVLKNAAGGEVFKTVSKPKGVSYELKGIRLGQFSPLTQRARVSFSFARLQNGKEHEVKRFANIFVKVNAGKIEECININEQTALSFLPRFCKDLDPTVPPNEDCLDNYERLLAQTKKLYCDEHPMLVYVAATGKCEPLDAGKMCDPGQYFKGYDANGEKVCFNGVVTLPPACSSWEPPTPDSNTVCAGIQFTQTQKCSTSTETRNVTGVGTKTTGCMDCKVSASVSWSRTKCMGCTGSFEFDRIRECTCDATGPVTIASGSSYTYNGTGQCVTEMNNVIQSTSTSSGTITYSCDKGVLKKGVGTCAP